MMDEYASIYKNVIEWRRHLHQYPELSFQEEKTAQFVYDTLSSFENLEISRPTRTSVVARLSGARPGKRIGLRADMDALPIQEEHDSHFRSRHPGVMHACGHDGHTAMLLGAAEILSRKKDELSGEVYFIFQHAEEVHPGGAQEMVKAGVADHLDLCIAIHLFSAMPLGKIGLASGPVTANSDRFDITIKGKGGHASQPEQCIDPLVIASQVITHLQSIASRHTDPAERLVLSVTMCHAGSAYNVIPDTVTLGGTVRTFRKEVRANTEALMETIIKGVTEAHGASYDFDYRHGYKSVVNDPNVTELVRQAAENLWGKDQVFPLAPMMGGEDFSAFSERVPSCYIALGAGTGEMIYPHHHPKFTFDEKALSAGVELFVNSVYFILHSRESISMKIN
ncbi:M20 metallopeptidase family protein [Bacillus halotolerans]|uniref:M20 metallopeptidase family protein n=1 Tax=Bacillus halotolerans TaxID=260554 RepID=UPI00227DEBDA|nr:amidohydrolase [Bacillus halotolerans]MCY8474511.1 amidohydrolase [Bacillus halotolerans]